MNLCIIIIFLLLVRLINKYDIYTYNQYYIGLILKKKLFFILIFLILFLCISDIKKSRV